MHRARIGAWLFVTAAGALLPAAASLAATAYLPVNLAPRLEDNVERLMLVAGRPVLSRPIAVADVEAALPQACAVDRPLCDEVRQALAPWLAQMAITHAGVSLSARHTNGNDSLALPDSHGAALGNPWQADVGAQWRLGNALLVNAGAVGNGERTTPTGSYLSIGGGRMQVDLGYRDRWWSPLHDSAMLLSTEAATLPSAGVSNVTPLTRARIRYEAFLGALSRSDAITWQGGLVSGRPRLFGVHLSVEPVPGWSLSVSRLMQFGGGPRPSSLSDLLRTFFNSTKYDNTSSSLNTDQEFGNQQFAFASEFVIPGRRPVAVYAELAAEDNFHVVKYRFGNSALSAGLYLPRLTPTLRLRYEYSNWQNAWYVHHIYLDGMSNYGHVLGNWAADWRVPGDGVGGESHMLDLGWSLDRGRELGLRYRTAQNAGYSANHYDRAHDLTLELSGPWRGNELAASLEFGRDDFGQGYGRLTGSVRLGGRTFGVGDTPASGGDTARGVPGEARYERFVDVGLSAVRSTYDLDAGTIPTKMHVGASPHIAFGVRRVGEGRNDVGARLELDRVEGRLLAAVRAVDIRHRYAGRWASNYYFGVARYQGATPALGWYLGTGLQRRELLPGWDLGLDLSYGDRVQRDKLLPGEVINLFPDAFYTFTSATVSLSHRF